MGEGEERVVNPFDLIEYLVQRHLRPRLGRVVLALLAFGFRVVHLAHALPSDRAGRDECRSID